MKKFSPYFLTLLLSLTCSFNALAYGPKMVCQYSADAKDIALQWTGFKFTEKTPVKGKFTQVKLDGKTSAKSLVELMKNWTADIDASSVESNDPVRNKNLKESFFAKFAPASQIHATTIKAVGTEVKGVLTVQIKMNGVTRNVPFTYTATPEGAVEAKGSIDLMDYSLKSAVDSLHTTCQTQHTGKDGVSKTWSQVDLLLTGKFEKKCPS